MDNNEERKQELKKLVDTDFTSYLLNEKIDILIQKKWGAVKWYLTGILAVIAAALTFYGFHIKDVSEKYDKELALLKEERERLTNEMDVKTENVKSKLDSLESILSLQSGAIISQEKQLNFQNQTIAQGLNFSSLYSDLFKDQLQQTIQLRNNTERDIAKFSQLQKSIDSTVNKYSSQYTQLNSLRESFKNQIESIEQRNNQNTLNASIRYVYAERSDRGKGTLLNAYKPSTIVLPNKADTLTFIFFNASKKNRTNKTALIDVYSGKNKHERSPIEINEVGGVLTPSKISLGTNNESYVIEPVFLYFPPNVGGALVIPDFVVLKIRLKDTDDE